MEHGPEKVDIRVLDWLRLKKGMRLELNAVSNIGRAFLFRAFDRVGEVLDYKSEVGISAGETDCDGAVTTAEVDELGCWGEGVEGVGWYGREHGRKGFHYGGDDGAPGGVVG